MIRKFSLALATCASLSTAGTAIADKLTELNVIMPTQRSNLFYPLIVAESLGYFEDEGLKINLLPSQTTVPFVSFLSNGNADVAMLDGPQTFQAVNASIPIGVVYEAQQTAPEGVVVPADSDITTIEQLIGTTVGLVSDRDRATLAMTLDHVGYELSDTNMVVLGDGGPTLARSFTKQHVSAIAGALPDWIALEANGIKVRDITPPEMAETPANSFVIHKSRQEELNDELTGFLRGWSKGAYVTKVDQEVIAAMMARAVPEEWQNPEFGQAFLEGAIPLNYPVTERFGDLRPESWEKVQAEMLRVGEISQHYDVNNFLMADYISPANDFDRAQVEQDVAAWRQANM